MDQNFDYVPKGEQQNSPPIDFQVPPPRKSSNGFAIASLCLGLGAIFCICVCCCFYYLAFLLSVLSIVMAFLSRKKGEKMPGMSIAGLILSIFSILSFLCLLAIEIGVITMPLDQLKEILSRYGLQA